MMHGEAPDPSRGSECNLPPSARIGKLDWVLLGKAYFWTGGIQGDIDEAEKVRHWASLPWEVTSRERERDCVWVFVGKCARGPFYFRTLFDVVGCLAGSTGRAKKEHSPSWLKDRTSARGRSLD